MSEFPALNFQDFIYVDGGKLVTDSRRVAEVHQKCHDDVLKLIRIRVAEAGEWGMRNFVEAVYVNPRNQQCDPIFTMTKDGYCFLAAKLKGKQAVKYQIAYYEAFDAMAAFLKNQTVGIRFRADRLNSIIASLKSKVEPKLPTLEAPEMIQ